MARVAVIGTGPAGLMAADRLARAGVEVTIHDKRPSSGRKLLVAGSSGLNITYEAATLAEFAAHYTAPAGRAAAWLAVFSPRDWTGFIERELGIPTFVGTSRRYFVEGMKASEMLRAWVARLQKLGARFELGRELVGLSATAGGVEIALARPDAPTESARYDAVVLALGGGSWEPKENPLRWPAVLQAGGVEIRPFSASNVGYRVEWPAGLIAEAEGKPIKNVALETSRGRRAGDLVITSYGVEGTPVYFAGETGVARLDLKPDLPLARVVEKLRATRDNLSPMRRVQKLLGLSEGACALVFHLAPRERLATVESAAALVKSFELQLGQPQPLEEAISSRGGVAWSELDDELMLRRLPEVYAVGEMIDWDAPTGGFLIQASVSQGRLVGDAIARKLRV